MRICVSGTQNIGKTTFVQDFLKEFPMYKSPETSYREILKDKNIKINQEGNQESQEAIMNYMCDEAMNYTNANNVIFDRCILDNVIYSMYLNEKDPKNISDAFIHKSLQLCRETSKFYDIIFIFPDTKQNKIELEERENRDIDENYRKDLDLLFKAAYKTYIDGRTLFFDQKDCPGVIEMFGSREERIEITKMYIDNKTGKLQPPKKIF